MFVLVFVFFAAISCEIVELDYLVESGEEVQYHSIYDTNKKTPYKVINLYSCEKGKIAYDTSSPSRPGFKHDPRLENNQQAVNSDYTNTGFSRGHLVPAKYFSYSTHDHHNTFYLTNVAPQPQTANQLWWTKDEAVVLFWAARNENCINDVVIETGVSGSRGTISEKEIVVPEKFVNVVCEPITGNSICFWIENVERPETVNFCDVRSCEGQLKFFQDWDVPTKFPNCLERKKDLDVDFWGLTENPNYFVRNYLKFKRP